MQRIETTSTQYAHSAGNRLPTQHNPKDARRHLRVTPTQPNYRFTEKSDSPSLRSN